MDQIISLSTLSANHTSEGSRDIKLIHLTNTHNKNKRKQKQKEILKLTFKIKQSFFPPCPLILPSVLAVPLHIYFSSDTQLVDGAS